MGIFITKMKLSTISLLFLLILGNNYINAKETETSGGISQKETKRDPKLLPVFQVVRFPNDACTGTSLNGTCYTAEECSNKGGTNEGSCASGFGVCCSFSLGCGTSNAENNSYIIQASATSITSPCKHKICPCSTNVCRIRYDFVALTLAAQNTATAAAAATSPAADSGAAFKVGQCTLDTFSISSPGGYGTPQICGTNSGYHMVVDTNGYTCQEALFAISPSTTTTRSWTIRVTQYTCGEEDSSGPPGCLQWYTSTSNYIQNYGFPTSITSSSTTVATTVTHLNNQNYNICIRRGSGYCYICYSTLSAGTDPQAFGLSIAPADASTTGTDASCTTDYIEIPGAETAANAAIVAPAALGINSNTGRICGRQFGIQSTATADISVCSKKKPFRVGVKFDESEICTAAAGNTCEWDTIPGGIIGFKLIYWQVAC